VNRRALRKSLGSRAMRRRGTKFRRMRSGAIRPQMQPRPATRLKGLD
jgi:hypothetical protein